MVVKPDTHASLLSTRAELPKTPMADMGCLQLDSDSISLVRTKCIHFEAGTLEDLQLATEPDHATRSQQQPSAWQCRLNYEQPIYILGPAHRPHDARGTSSSLQIDREANSLAAARLRPLVPLEPINQQAGARLRPP